MRERSIAAGPRARSPLGIRGTPSARAAGADPAVVAPWSAMGGCRTQLASFACAFSAIVAIAAARWSGAEPGSGGAERAARGELRR